MKIPMFLLTLILLALASFSNVAEAHCRPKPCIIVDDPDDPVHPPVGDPGDRGNRMYDPSGASMFSTLERSKQQSLNLSCSVSSGDTDSLYQQGKQLWNQMLCSINQ